MRYNIDNVTVVLACMFYVQDVDKSCKQSYSLAYKYAISCVKNWEKGQGLGGRRSLNPSPWNVQKGSMESHHFEYHSAPLSPPYHYLILKTSTPTSMSGYAPGKSWKRFDFPILKYVWMIFRMSPWIEVSQPQPSLPLLPSSVYSSIPTSHVNVMQIIQ